MIRCLFVLGALATPVSAQPSFTDRSDTVDPPHIYQGGWEHFVGGGLAVFDCNQDGYPDALVAGGSAPARLLINTTEGSGGDVSFGNGRIPDIMGVTGAYPLDINADGHLDLVILRVGQNLLLQGDGSCTFRDASTDWGYVSEDRWTTAFSATWETNAKWPTLAFGNYVDRSNPDGPFEACDANQLYRPDDTGYGTPVTLEPGFCALSMLFSDWRRSGAPQLRISNDRHYYVRGGYEEMWQLDPLKPLGEADGWDRVSLWGMGIASGDVTQNGFPDVMLTSMGDQVLMFNSGTTWTAAPFDTGATAHRPHTGDDGRPSTGWHAQFGDVDNDGFADLFLAKGNVDQMPGMAMDDPNNLLLAQPDGKFQEVAKDAGIASSHRSRGAALVDLNRDGLLDLLVVNRRAPLEVWQNTTINSGGYIHVSLSMTGANRNAVGAWVELTANGKTQVQEVTVGGGHVSGQSVGLHFGIGDAQSADIRVQWPGGDWSAPKTVEVNSSTVLVR